MREEIIFIPFLMPSENDWLKTHYRVRSKIKDKVKSDTFLIIKEQMIRNNIKPFTDKVIIESQPYVGQIRKGERKLLNNTLKKQSTRPLDKINYAPSIKFFEDCIVKSGLLIDDSNKYVLQHQINEVIVDRNIYGDGMIIVIKEVPDDYSEERNEFFYEKVLNDLDKVKK